MSTITYAGAHHGFDQPAGLLRYRPNVYNPAGAGRSRRARRPAPAGAARGDRRRQSLRRAVAAAAHARDGCIGSIEWICGAAPLRLVRASAVRKPSSLWSPSCDPRFQRTSRAPRSPPSLPPCSAAWRPPATPRWVSKSSSRVGNPGTTTGSRPSWRSTLPTSSAPRCRKAGKRSEARSAIHFAQALRVRPRAPGRHAVQRVVPVQRGRHPAREGVGEPREAAGPAARRRVAANRRRRTSRSSAPTRR